MNNVVYPEKFQKAPGPMSDRVLSKESALSIYTALFNLYHSANNGHLAQAILVTQMTQNPKGLDVQETLSAASIISNNAVMLQKMRDVVGQLMHVLAIESRGVGGYTYHAPATPAPPEPQLPDDQPPLPPAA